MILKPIISVIVPVHNTVEYLPKCVESIRNQSLKEIEIILVDNLSTDGSSGVCDEYALVDSRIKVLHLSEAGLSIARNAGIKVASALYIGFVDSDDHILPCMYEEMLAALRANNADLAYCNFCYEYDSGYLEFPFSNSNKVYLRNSNEVVCDIIQDVVSSSACTKLFRKKLFEDLLFPEGVFFEDHKTTYRWVAKCKNVVWVDKTFYYYYQRQTSICHTLDPRKHYDYFLAEYSRLAFIQERSLFTDIEVIKVNTMIVRNCFMHFKEILLMTKPGEVREQINDMRTKIGKLRSISKRKIDIRCYKRIRKISYFWPIYYFSHFYFKRKEWRL